MSADRGGKKRKLASMNVSKKAPVGRKKTTKKKSTKKA